MQMERKPKVYTYSHALVKPNYMLETPQQISCTPYKYTKNSIASYKNMIWIYKGVKIKYTRGQSAGKTIFFI